MNSSSLDIPCVILCGGKSSRMGEDKSLLPFDSSKTLTQYQFDKLKKIFKKVYLSSKDNKFDFIKKDELILDDSNIYSPIVALNSIFTTLKDKNIFIITVDTPLIKLDSIKKLISSHNSYDSTIAKTHRVHNLCGIYNREKALFVIDKMLSEDFHKVGFLLKELNTQYIQFSSEDEFINLNDKNEYKKALSIIR
ncbi:molybdenum cofactor guanylyltransferase MobA [Halarcobacter bivalviorum]|uniref:molybdenum cofactor guanylyltransferase MobA n=1 Tax=Halarcobacter bivalviorum TaxID=663364 RepID=UPI00100B91CD|nr:molybdenum cofactor guanylyltransferase MobA [Halarcobacter bivalviorum]RXK05750.1 molybdenum cofactor guanylyltransferase [Halarcobacter bivalviorum]